MKKVALFILSLSFVLTTSCSRDERESFISAEEVSINNKMDRAADDVSDLIEEQEALTYANNVTGKSTDLPLSVLTSCATITRVPAFGTPVAPGTTVTKTIDFGTTGCLLSNGNTVKGKIIMSFVFQPSATSHTITYHFDNFYHNNILIVGSKVFTRVMTVATPESPSHPIVTMNMELTATFPNGVTVTRVGQRVREIIDGYGDAVFLNNVYQITGSWVTTYPNESTKTSTITTPLIAKMSCITPQKPVLVSGVITFVRNNTTATLDYGDGNCDNLAVFTINGNSFNITIGN